MKRRTRFIFTVLIAVLIFIASPAAVFAEKEAASLELPVSVRFTGTDTGTAPPSAVFELSSPDGAPLPKGSEDGVYRFEIKGNGRANVRLTFDKTGTWTYILTAGCNGGAITPEKVIVTVKVVDEGDVLTAFAVVEREDGKKSEIDFTVNIKPNGDTRPDNPQTGDDSNLGFYVAAMCVSLILIAALAVYLFKDSRRRRRM